jgi:hypothetical protein
MRVRLVGLDREGPGERPSSRGGRHHVEHDVRPVTPRSPPSSVGTRVTWS